MRADIRAQTPVGLTGLEIGKIDFLPHMMKYMTKGPG
jgi:hypothetical protein